MKTVKHEHKTAGVKIRKQMPCITGLGLACSVGHDHITACASMRAGLRRPIKMDHYYAEAKDGYDDPDDGLVTGHLVLEGDCDETMERMARLLAMAIEDLSHNIGIEEPWKDTLFCLALPGPERLPLDNLAMYHLIPEQIRAEIPVTRCRFYPQGHSGMILAINDMAAAMDQGSVHRAVIAGTDSLVNMDDLVRFEQQNRLKTFLNPDGLTPGEAASALLLETRSSAERGNATIRAHVAAVSKAMDDRHVLSGKPPHGTGLSTVIQAILSQAGPEELAVDAVIIDLNGEPFRFEEWALTGVRLGRRITGEKNLTCPALFIGDTGSASPGAAIAVAVRGMERGCLAFETDEPAGKALIVSGSDTGERGALLIEQTKNQKP